MTTAQYQITDFTVDDPATIKAKLDGNSKVAVRTAAAYQAYAAAVPNMTVKVAAGGRFVSGVLVENAIQTSGVIVAPAVNPRIDRVVINQATGVASIVGGVEAGVPVPPLIPSGFEPCAQIALTTITAAITNALITDERVPAGTGAAAASDALAFLQSI